MSSAGDRKTSFCLLATHLICLTTRCVACQGHISYASDTKYRLPATQDVVSQRHKISSANDTRCRLRSVYILSTAPMFNQIALHLAWRKSRYVECGRRLAGEWRPGIKTAGEHRGATPTEVFAHIMFKRTMHVCSMV